MSEQVGWRGLLRNLREEAPQWSVLLPKLPRLAHQALAGAEPHRFEAALRALGHGQKRQSQMLALLAGGLGAVILLLVAILATR